MNVAILTPAYNRVYANAQAIRIDWDADKDFIINNITDRWCGKYCNRSDMLKSDYTHVKLYYGSEYVLLEI